MFLHRLIRGGHALGPTPCTVDVDGGLANVLTPVNSWRSCFRAYSVYCRCGWGTCQCSYTG